ncbi:MAG: hypothetical protein JW904_13170 [Spirochaetales bacterium]|nr:hypothetical protein [Spirochaetales bacterium]
MAVQEFQFELMTIKVAVVVDGIYCTIKQGLSTKKIELNKITYLYSHHIREITNECIIVYETDAGKSKLFRFSSNFGDPGFKKTVDAIAACKPGADIRSMPEKEAHKLMKAVNVGSITPLIVFIVVIALFSVFFLPAILHGLDSGRETVDIALCRDECKTASRNVVLSGGYLYLEVYAYDETTNDNFIAYVPADWSPGDPVYAVIKTPPMSESDLAGLANQEHLNLVLRNVLWEGLESDIKDYYTNELSMPLAGNVRLFEYGADTGFDLMMALVIIGLAMIILFAVMLVISRIQKGMG